MGIFFVFANLIVDPLRLIYCIIVLSLAPFVLQFFLCLFCRTRRIRLIPVFAMLLIWIVNIWWWFVSSVPSPHYMDIATAYMYKTHFIDFGSSDQSLVVIFGPAIVGMQFAGWGLGNLFGKYILAKRNAEDSLQ